ncbi:molybdopterin molybdotransferase MoeA [Aggregicoccus sp. 17bor-14]|uniref:molybdopterin molybdotransferase MoeA n=1 Tax=Myxococcaceae TaxID=31 RepID=UPI00129C159F|nr:MULTISPECIES: gephyrin-like molybdotransferase Glp [Myxococcaceae]MBF5044139.1 molybdopterin molybdotransferase MoeA [Simulacricoccus sp. 17bor-14]MRI89889.1 molybdopterin molybdotransferase MoeA [Aggregicoccus sp. 17bor-14]
MTPAPPDAALLSVEEARARALALLPTLPPERVPLAEALGRCLAEDVVATRTLPPWDNSAMDGYAVASSALQAPFPVRLRVVETLYAGQRAQRTPGPGECTRLMTGAPLPPGTDAVVMQERVAVEPDGTVLFDAPAPAGQFVRSASEDARAGELLLARGTPLGLPELGLLLAQGRTEASVPRRPRVAILSTGDELCRADEPPGERIVDTNGPLLALAVARAGGLPTLLGIARDTLEDVERGLSEAEGYDVVLTSAGVSVGAHDHVRAALERRGVQMGFWRVAVKPGKPLAVGRKGASVYFGLPGNPTSSLVSFELFVRPALRRLLGFEAVEPVPVAGRLRGALKKPAGLAHYVRVQATWRDGALWASPLHTQTSGALRSSSAATHLLHFPREATGLAEGAPVELLPLSWTAG